MLNKESKSLNTQDKEDRKKLASYLKNGDRETIAELAGVHRNTVSNWIHGRVENSVVGGYVKAFSDKRRKKLEDKINGVEAE